MVDSQLFNVSSQTETLQVTKFTKLHRDTEILLQITTSLPLSLSDQSLPTQRYKFVESSSDCTWSALLIINKMLFLNKLTQLNCEKSKFLDVVWFSQNKNQHLLLTAAADIKQTSFCFRFQIKNDKNADLGLYIYIDKSDYKNEISIWRWD